MKKWKLLNDADKDKNKNSLSSSTLNLEGKKKPYTPKRVSKD